MSEYTPSEEPTGGLDRRDFVKRAAAAGAMAWAAPSLTTVSSAFANVGGSEICIPVDPFTAGQAIAARAGEGPSVGQVADAGILGGFRDALIEAFDDGTAGGNNRAKLSIGNGFAQLSQPTGISAHAELAYDGANAGPPIDPNGLGGVDATADGGDRFRLNVVIDQASTVVDFTIQAWDTAGGTASVAVSLSVDTANDTALFEARFADFSGVDFTSLGAIRLTIDAPVAVDLVSLGLRICHLN